MKERLCRKNLLCALLMSISSAFTLLFFSPADIYLGNMDEFLVGAEHVLIPVLLLALSAAAAVFILLFIFMLINQTLFNSAACLIFGLECAAYSQMLFWNGKMQVVTEAADSYAERNVFNYLNFIVFYVILFLPLILYFAKKSYKAKLYKVFNRVSLTAAAAIILAMQLAGTGSSMLTMHKTEPAQYGEYLSFEPTLSLSKEKNIVVFIIDRFDGSWMRETEEDYPELYDKFDGFTFYANDLSRYSQTFPAVANLLTGAEYDGTGNFLFLKKAWTGENPLDKLRDNGFVSNYLLETPSSFNNINYLHGHCDNIRTADSDYSFNYLGEDGIVPVMTKLAFSKTLPYFMKPLASEYVKADFMNYLVKYDNEPEDMEQYNIGVLTDLKYYDYIRTHEINADSDQKVFNFIHFVGAHDISYDLSELYDGFDPSEANRRTTIRGDLEIVFYYMEQMKKLGVYDNSTILIMGDHAREFDGLLDDNDMLIEPLTTALMIKPENSHGKLQDNDTAEMSHSYFQASLLEYAGIDHSEYGCSYNDVINNNISAARSISLQSVWDTEYEVTGNAEDLSSWKCIRCMGKDIN